MNCVKVTGHPVLLTNGLIMRHKIKGNFCVPVHLHSGIQKSADLPKMPFCCSTHYVKLCGLLPGEPSVTSSFWDKIGMNPQGPFNKPDGEHLFLIAAFCPLSALPYFTSQCLVMLLSLYGSMWELTYISK